MSVMMKYSQDAFDIVFRLGVGHGQLIHRPGDAAGLVLSRPTPSMYCWRQEFGPDELQGDSCAAVAAVKEFFRGKAYSSQWTPEELAELAKNGKVDPYVFNRLPKLTGPSSAEFEALKVWSRENPNYTAIAARVAAEDTRQEQAAADVAMINRVVKLFEKSIDPTLMAAPTPPTSGREIAIRQQEELARLGDEGDAKWGWVLVQVRAAWPRATWKLKEFDGWDDPKVGLAVKIGEHDLGDGDFYIPKWRDAWRLRDGTSAADITKLIAGAKGRFADHVKHHVREAKRNDIVSWSMGIL